jgi:DNA-binding NtrC family response regulator
MSPKPAKIMTERNAILHLNSWAGRSRHRVVVIGETAKRYRIRYEDTPALQRWQTGEVYLVPKYAITFEEQKSKQMKPMTMQEIDAKIAELNAATEQLERQALRNALEFHGLAKQQVARLAQERAEKCLSEESMQASAPKLKGTGQRWSTIKGE